MKSYASFFVSSSLLPVLLFSLLLGCDSNEVDFNDVSGEFIFTTYTFTPESSLLRPVDMLDTLIVTETRLQLFSSGRFALLYQFKGASPQFIGGNFTATSQRVRLNGNIEELKFYESLLLSNEVTFNRESNGGLSAEYVQTANLDAFSREYKGLPSVRGALKMEMQREP